MAARIICRSFITGVLWIVSYFWIIVIVVPGTSVDSLINIEPATGRLTILISHYSPPPADRGPALSASPISATREATEKVRAVGIMMDRLEDMPSFEWSTFSFPPYRGVTWNGRKIAFPYWVVFLLSGCWPAVALVRWAR